MKITSVTTALEEVASHWCEDLMVLWAKVVRNLQVLMFHYQDGESWVGMGRRVKGYEREAGC